MLRGGTESTGSGEVTRSKRSHKGAVEKSSGSAQQEMNAYKKTLYQYYGIARKKAYLD